MKEKLKKLKRSLHMLKAFYCDFNNYKKHSLMVRHEDVGQDNILGLIIRLYHTIEKGLSIQDRKNEFSLKNVELLQFTLLKYTGSNSEKHILSAVKTLDLYFSVHEGVVHSSEFLEQIEIFKKIAVKYEYNETPGGIKDLYHFNNSSACVEHIKNRSSVRVFNDEKIEFDKIVDIVDTAKYCPSACNRHAIKLFYSLSLSNNEKILELQNGSRTFRNKVPGLFIVASDIRYQEGIEERGLGLVEGGIWIMSLVNSLHFNGLGSCVLNWCVTPEQDLKLKKTLNIPTYYQISALIAFGYPDNKQKVPYSIRKETNNFLFELK